MFVRLTRINGSEVAVNPMSVRFLSRQADGTTDIHFDKDHFIVVRGDLKEVSRILSMAMRPVPPRE